MKNSNYVSRDELRIEKLNGCQKKPKSRTRGKTTNEKPAAIPGLEPLENASKHSVPALKPLGNASKHSVPNKCISVGIGYIKKTVRYAVESYKKGFTNPKLYDNMTTSISNYVWIVDYTDKDPKKWFFVADKASIIDTPLIEIEDVQSFYKLFVEMIKKEGDMRENILTYNWQSGQKTSYIILTRIDGKKLAFGAGFYCKSPTDVPSTGA